jgi:ribose-phosphate pyrophosphokinase
VAAGADRVLGIDFHQHQIQGFFDIPVDHLYAAPVLTQYFIDKGLDDLVVVARTWVREDGPGVCPPLEASFAIIDKRRPAPNQSGGALGGGRGSGKNCLIVDDMVDTAGRWPMPCMRSRSGSGGRPRLRHARAPFGAGEGKTVRRHRWRNWW